MYYFDAKQHKLPHIHAKYQGKEAIFAIPDGEIIEGNIPSNKQKLIEAWIEIHKDELIANWELAASGEQVFKIEGLK